MYIRSILYLVFLILDKGAAPRNVEIKFYKVFKSFILSAINGFKTWDKEVFDKLYIYIYIYIYITFFICMLSSYSLRKTFWIPDGN